VADGREANNRQDEFPLGTPRGSHGDTDVHRDGHAAAPVAATDYDELPVD